MCGNRVSTALGVGFQTIEQNENFCDVKKSGKCNIARYLKIKKPNLLILYIKFALKIE